MFEGEIVKIAVLFDGAGLARLGLEQAGHNCTGFELDPIKHYLSTKVGVGECVKKDVLDIDVSDFDGVWASPPCQWISRARTQGKPLSKYALDYREWVLNFKNIPLWVENVLGRYNYENSWGLAWNAAQFEESPRQNRVRIIGGNYPNPKVYRIYKRNYKELDICPCITATEYKGCASDQRRASRYYGRKLSVFECAYRQGFEIPGEWFFPYINFDGNFNEWEKQLYEAIGNGVPVFMAKKFGEAVAV